ncbi:MAG: D-alanyl-D-alanine carboxypeptidase [Solirubrobacterales bacterium]
MSLGSRSVLMALAAFACAATLALASCGGDDGESTVSGENGREARVGSLPADAEKIFAKDPYSSARWTYRVQPVGSDDPTLAAGDEIMTVLGSTAKNFTVASAYETLGPDKKITTPVYEVEGELVLVAMGDLAMGGRGAMKGDFNSSSIDKVYANAIPGASIPEGNPLAGLSALAKQTADSGVKSVRDVNIDDRLFEAYDAGGTGGGAVSPIVINDNQVDIKLTPTEPGEPVKVEVIPETDLYSVDVDVKTVEGDGGGEESGQDLGVIPGDNPNSLKVEGSIEADGDPAVRSLIPPDPALFAKTLFIAELEEAGVKVTNPTDKNDLEGLPAFDAYEKSDEVAALTSPPIKEFGSMILTTSYNQGADMMLCYLAIDLGSDDCDDGLKTINALVKDDADIEPSKVVLVDGHGGDPASATPEAINAWLQWITERPWSADFEAGLPVLGESGSLASSGADSPARGKVAAKTGTSVRPYPPEFRLFVTTQGLAGYMESDEGKQIFSLYVGGATFDEIIPGLFEVGGDVADVSAAFQQSLTE